jgi:hypothetical protein
MEKLRGKEIPFGKIEIPMLNCIAIIMYAYSISSLLSNFLQPLCNQRALKNCQNL